LQKLTLTQLKFDVLKKIDPQALYFETNEWIKKSENDFVIGITDFAQTVFGAINFVELIDVGKKINKGDKIAEVESTKSLTEIYSPISGTIVSINAEIISNPELLNVDPYDKGWLVKIMPSNKNELEELMDAAAYKNYMDIFYNKKR